ncbi:MAG: DUF551 domain-containing protein [Bacteroidales bacterium]|jgi:hypothetical protein|nr:DUF551 domain-containing protein [Bacteroidales bacterium]
MQKLANDYANSKHTDNELQKIVANDFFAGATAMYAALKEQIEWVSVENRLPESTGSYIVKCNTLYSGKYRIAFFNATHNDFKLSDDKHVTHGAKLNYD